MTTATRPQSFLVPGAEVELQFERDEQGRLLLLRAAGREYARREGTVLVLGEGLARVAEMRLGARVVRTVRTPYDSWLEEYAWDEQGRPCYVDGVVIRRDERGRVVGCESGSGEWCYRYAGDRLVEIRGPGLQRRIRCGEDGRPIRVVEGSVSRDLRYDADGRRAGPELPDTWIRDSLGRVWTVLGPDGEVRTTFLWDGWACIGRIDGSPGEPLAVVFSLDPSFTPIRLIEPDGYRRIPRDAFGEALLRETGVPGLFGAAVFGGRHHLRSRIIDPATGSFDRPDPWRGGADDPRRRPGRSPEDVGPRYRGPLATEPGPGGPYAVCSGDPIGRTDPTGELSVGSFFGGFLLTLSSLTWSSQHVLAGFFVLEVIMNMLTALFSFSGAKIKRLASIEGLSAEYTGAWGFRFDPVGIEVYGLNVGRAWTYQHIVWARDEEFSELQRVRCFVPSAAFRPTCYGTILHIRSHHGHDDDDPAVTLLLAGSAWQDPNPGHPQTPERPRGWVRSGEAGEPVLPGSPVPHFPRGGLHFDVDDRMHGPQDGSIVELDPSGDVVLGLVQRRLLLAVPGTGLGIAAGDRLFLLTGTETAEIIEVRSTAESGSETRVRCVADPTVIAVGTSIRTRGLEAAAVSTDTHSASATTGRLDARGTGAATYVRGDPVRLLQGGTAVGAAVIQRLDARIEVDEALTAASGPAPHRVVLAQPSGTASPVTVAGPRLLEFPSGTPPAEGDTIVVIGGGRTQGFRVTGAPAANRREVDRAIAAPISGAPAGSVNWQPLTAGAVLGEWDASAGSTQLTYTPDTSGQAPDRDHVLIRNQFGATTQVRDVTARLFDEMALFSTALPGSTATPYTVERLRFRALDVNNCALREFRAVVFPAPLPAALTTLLTSSPKPALGLTQFNGVNAAALVGGAAVEMLHGGARAGNVVTGNPATAGFLPLGHAGAHGPTPGAAVVARSGAAIEPAVVKEVRLRATLDRSLTLTGADLRVSLLEAGSFAYRAVRRGADQVVLEPTAFRLDPADQIQVDASGTPQTVEVEMPRFQVGELILAGFGTAATPELFRVSAVDGATLTLEGGTIGSLPAAPATFAVRRMVPADPATGSIHRGVGGSIAGGTALTCKVWGPNALLPGALVAVADASKALPARVTTVDEVAVELFNLPGSFPAGAVDIIAPPVRDTEYRADYTLEGGDLVMEGSMLTPTSDLTAVTPFVEAPAAATERRATGELGGGTVMIPEDNTESWELTRRESLETHELRHTQQSAMMGPLLLALVPIFLLDLLPTALGSDMEAPEFSRYVDGELVEQGSDRLLAIPNPGDVEFETGDRVQISQQNQQLTVELGRQEGQSFVVTGTAALRPGAVFVRRHRSGTGDVLAGIYRWATLDSLGGLMTAVVGPIYAFLPWLIALIVRAAKGDFDIHWWLDYYDAEVPDSNRPAQVRVLPKNGERLSLNRNDTVQMEHDGVTKRTTVTAVGADGIVELRDPPTTGTDGRFRIGHLGDDDPLGGVVSAPLNEMGFSGLRWLFDPWGQLHYRTTPEPDSGWDWFLRVARWGFSSTSWIGFPLGIFFFDNLLKQPSGRGHLSSMEQGASQMSGDLYSSLGRLYGRLEVVGDVARYYFYPVFRTDSVLRRGQQDAPGVHMQELIRVLPSFAPTTPPTTALNDARAAAPASAGQVPDALFAKDLRQPDRVPGTAPPGFIPGTLGWVPPPQRLERTQGAHVAFTRPGLHLITATDNYGSIGESREAQEEGKQTIYYEKQVNDVTVRAGEETPANGATLRLVHCQRVTLVVEPGDDRSYSVAMLTPERGSVLQRFGDLAIQALDVSAREAVEVTRNYPARAFAVQKDSSRALPQHALGDELRVPVRSFTVEVVNTLPCHEALAMPLVERTETRPGSEVFVLVPVRIVSASPPMTAVYTPPAPAGTRDPAPSVSVVTDVPEALRERVRDGGVFRIGFEASDPPEEEVALTWQISVRGRARNAAGTEQDISSNLTVSIRLRPHFRLALPAAGNTVARGAAIRLSCTDGATPGQVTVTPSAGTTVTTSGANIDIAVDAAAATGPRTVLVERQGTPAEQARRTIVVT